MHFIFPPAQYWVDELLMDAKSCNHKTGLRNHEEPIQIIQCSIFEHFAFTNRYHLYAADTVSFMALFASCLKVLIECERLTRNSLQKEDNVTLFPPWLTVFICINVSAWRDVLSEANDQPGPWLPGARCRWHCQYIANIATNRGLKHFVSLPTYNGNVTTHKYWKEIYVSVSKISDECL